MGVKSGLDFQKKLFRVSPEVDLLFTSVKA